MNCAHVLRTTPKTCSPKTVIPKVVYDNGSMTRQGVYVSKKKIVKKIKLESTTVDLNAYTDSTYLLKMLF